MKKVLPFLLLLAGFGLQMQAQTIILFEDFENVATGTTPPSGWSRSQATPSYGFEFGDANAVGSAFYAVPAHTIFACSNDDAHDDNTTTLNDASEDRLITPVMDLTPYASSGVIVEFDVHNPGTYGSTANVEATTDGGTTWNVVSAIPLDGNWQTVSYSLAAYTGSSTVQIAFRHNDGGNWADGVSVDNVSVRSVPAIEMEMTSLSIDDYAVAGNVDITGTITNNGFTTITAVDVIYTINGGAQVTDNITGLSLNLGDTYNFTHSTPANLMTPGLYTLAVSVKNPNGSGNDANTNNDEVSKDVSILSAVPVKNALLQDFTGAWCQFCPDGTAIMDDILTQDPNVIGVATHIGDAMEISDGNSYANEYISGYPSGIVDLYKFEDQSDVEINRGLWAAKSAERHGMTVPVSVSIESQSYDDQTRQATVTVAADFVGTVSDDLRMNLWFIENGVTGTGSGYDQVNFYNTQSGHPYAGAGNPIVGFVHNHTLRHMAGGPWGVMNSIPGPIVDGYTATFQFQYTIPQFVDETEVMLIPIVQRWDQADVNARPFLNSAEVALQTSTAMEELKVGEVTRVYPNPFSDRTRIEFDLTESVDATIEVYDMVGKRVKTLANGFMNAGTHAIVWDGSNDFGTQAGNGIYTIVLSGNNQKIVSKVMLNR